MNSYVGEDSRHKHFLADSPAGRSVRGDAQSALWFLWHQSKSGLLHKAIAAGDGMHDMKCISSNRSSRTWWRRRSSSVPHVYLRCVVVKTLCRRTNHSWILPLLVSDMRMYFTCNSLCVVSTCFVCFLAFFFLFLLCYFSFHVFVSCFCFFMSTKKLVVLFLVRVH